MSTASNIPAHSAMANEVMQLTKRVVRLEGQVADLLSSAGTREGHDRPLASVPAASAPSPALTPPASLPPLMWEC